VIISQTYIEQPFSERLLQALVVSSYSYLAYPVTEILGAEKKSGFERYFCHSTVGVLRRPGSMVISMALIMPAVGPRAQWSVLVTFLRSLLVRSHASFSVASSP
jgi:hypothetical protein